MNTPCKHLSKFLKAELDIMRKHLDEHQMLRGIEDKNVATESFIHDFGWLLREMFCIHVCEDKDECEHAKLMKERGDLLRDKQK